MFDMFKESSQNRITIEDVDPKALSLLLEYFYTSKIKVNEENVQVFKLMFYLKNYKDVYITCYK